MKTKNQNDLIQSATPLRAAFLLLPVTAVLLLGCQSRSESAPAQLAEDSSAGSYSVPGTANPQALEDTSAVEEAQRAVAREQQALAEQEANLRQREEELAAKQELAKREAELAARERAVADRQRQARAEADTKAKQEAELASRERELAAERAALDRERERLAAEEAKNDPASAPSGDGPDDAQAGSRDTQARSEEWSGDESWRDRRPESSRPAAEPAPAPRVAGRLRAGMELNVEILQDLSSRNSQVGETFRTAIASDVVDSRGAVIVPAGSTLIGTVVDARPLRKVGGQAALELEFHRLIVGDEQIEIDASFVELGKNQKRDKAKIAGAAVAGAILGRVLGDGDNAVLGGVVGAAAGTAAVMQSKGQEVEIPAGTTMTLKLTEVVSSSGQYGPVVRPPS